MSEKPLSEAEVRQVIITWGRLWDEHAPIADFLPLVAEEGFEIRFRGQVWRGISGLEEHKEIKRQFFDRSTSSNPLVIVPIKADHLFHGVNEGDYNDDATDRTPIKETDGSQRGLPDCAL